MIKSSGWNRGNIQERFFSSWPLLVLSVIIALLVGLSLGLQRASIDVVIIGGLFMAILVILRQDEIAVGVIIAVHLYIDWYLALSGVALIIVLALLLIFFFTQSSRYPWITPPASGLWGLFLILAIFPAIQGALTVHDTLIYYPNIVFGAFIIYWLGTVIARDTISIRRLFQVLTVLAVLIAIHTILQSITGKFLFGLPSVDAYIEGTSNHVLDVGYAVIRSGSFFIDPNWNGTFFGLVLFLPLGLFVESSSFLEKAIYLAAMLIMLPALLFTYSAGAWISVFAGVIVFIVFVGRTRYRLQLSIFIVIAIIALAALFPAQIALQLQHTINSNDRVGVWLTALRIIYAYPLTGIGLGHQAYLLRAEPYRSLTQEVPLDHPHNSYLEWGAMAGIPVLIVFVALLAFTLGLAIRNWLKAGVESRPLLGAGITAVVTLSINSFTINGWTFPSLAALGWVLLGCLSSPLLAKSHAMPAQQIGSEEHEGDG
jgi:O-antigen ligase